MAPLRPAEPPTEQSPGDAAPRWHAPPRPRSAFEPSPSPPLTPPMPLEDLPPEPPHARGRLDRLGPPFLTLVLTLVAGAAAWPVVRDSLATPEPTATVSAPT